MTNNPQSLDIDSIPLCVAIYELDDDGDFIFTAFNKAAQEEENVSKDILLGQKIKTAYPGVEKMGLLEIFERVYKTGKTQKLDLGLYQDEHIYGWKKNIVSKLNEYSILVIFEDITDKNSYIKEFEKVIEQKTKALQELTDSLQAKVKEGVKKHEEQTNQLLMQSRLAQMGEMISMIAHQWRQPLGAISTTAVNLKLKIEFESFDFNSPEGITGQKNIF